MADEDDAIYTESLPSRTFALASAGVGGAFVITAIAYAVLGAMGDPTAFVGTGVFALVAVVLGALGVAYSVQRNRVTREAFKAELGLHEVTIPLESIEDVKIVQDSRELRKRIYKEQGAAKLALGASPQLVRIAWRKDGEPRVFYAGARYADQLAGALIAALGVGRKKAKVRVEAEAEPAEETVPARAAQKKLEKKR
jgi:hypothetical protein